MRFKLRDTLKSGWLLGQSAFEPYSVATSAFFIPLALEQLAKDNAGDDGRVAFLGFRVESASYSLYIGSISVIFQALAVISLGTAADNISHRMHLLTFVAIIGSFMCSSFYPLTGLYWPLAAIIAITAQTSYGIGQVCLNSFLPYLARRSVKRFKYGLDNDYAPVFTDDNEIDDNESFSHSETSSSTEELEDQIEGLQLDERMSVQVQTAKLSALGQAVGYSSGIIILIVLLIPLNMLSKTPKPPSNPIPPNFTRSIFSKRSPIVALRACVSFTGLLWAILSIPSIVLICRETKVRNEDGESLTYGQAIKEAWKRLWLTFRPYEINQLPSTYWFLLSWALLSDGFATITSTAILFARTQLDMNSTQLLIITVLSPLSGAIGAITFPHIQHALGWSNHKSLVSIVLAGLFVPIYGLLGFLPFVKQMGYGGLTEPIEMFGLAVYFGAVYGAFQSYARTVFSNLIPAGEEAHWFSIYAISSKSTSFIGSLLVGLLADKSSNIRSGFVAIMVLFVLPLPALISKVNPRQGQIDAKLYAQAHS